MISVIQQQYYGEREGSQVFFSYHPPAAAAANGRGLLICNALFEEMQDSRRTTVNFANLAAEAGFGILRFDYRGQGESSGDMPDFSPEDAIDDVAFAYRELLGKPGISRAGMLGVRFGGNLAAAAAAAGKVDPDFMILWAPEIDGASYAEMVLRSNLANQLIVHRAIVEDREALIARMREGQVINADGYGLNARWYRHLSSNRLAEDLNRYRGKELIMDLDPRPQRISRRWEAFLRSLELDPGRIEIQRLYSEMFWKLTPVYAVRPEEPFDKTMEYLKAHD